MMLGKDFLWLLMYESRLAGHRSTVISSRFVKTCVSSGLFKVLIVKLEAQQLSGRATCIFHGRPSIAMERLQESLGSVTLKKKTKRKYKKKSEHLYFCIA